MKKLLMTTAIALTMGGTAYAQTAPAAIIIYNVQDQQRDFAASELIGMEVFASENMVDDIEITGDQMEQQWDEIGNIEDVYISPEGEVNAVIVSIGGFLDIGDRHVAVDMNEIKMVRESGTENDFFLVVEASRAQLENAPTFQQEETMGSASTGMDAWTMDRDLMAAPMMERDGYATMEYNQLTTDDLTGASVYGINDEDIGEVSEVLMSDSGEIQGAILDIGGFLGLGEHHVQMDMSELQIMRSDSGMDLRVYVDSSQEALERMPEFEASAL